MYRSFIFKRCFAFLSMLILPMLVFAEHPVVILDVPFQQQEKKKKDEKKQDSKESDKKEKQEQKADPGKPDIVEVPKARKQPRPEIVVKPIKVKPIKIIRPKIKRP